MQKQDKRVSIQKDGFVEYKLAVKIYLSLLVPVYAACVEPLHCVSTLVLKVLKGGTDKL